MLLKLNTISKSYTWSAENKVREVLIKLDFELNSAQSVAVIGPSGCGKSTLLNILGALDKPDSGTYVFNNEDILRKTEPELANFRNTKIGFVFQQHHLLPQLTVYENIMLPTLAKKNGTNQQSLNQYCSELMLQLGIETLKLKRPAQLSGGESQRVTVARALINKPLLLLADEPTGSLDEANALAVADLLVNSAKQFGSSLIMVTHSLQVASKAQKVFRLQEGKLIEQK
ncbi:MAG TPA: ABC transporter [Bacteroidales bacterium]|nr:ABC transporter [Bacteroidales bacterium]